MELMDSPHIAEKTQKDLLRKSVQKKLLTFQKSDYLFHENEEADGIFFVKSGKVKITKSGGGNHSIILHIADGGEILGIHGVLNNHPHSNSAVALSRASVYKIPADEFLKIVKDEIGLKIMLMKFLCSKIDVLEDRFSKRNIKDTGKRLAETIVSLTKEYGLDSNNYLNLSLKPGDLAEMIGTSKEYLYRKLHDFNKRGLILTQYGKIKILDPKGLEKAAGTITAV